MEMYRESMSIWDVAFSSLPNEEQRELHKQLGLDSHTKLMVATQQKQSSDQVLDCNFFVEKNIVRWAM